jgi:hypothetical protein
MLGALAFHSLNEVTNLNIFLCCEASRKIQQRKGDNCHGRISVQMMEVIALKLQ